MKQRNKLHTILIIFVVVVISLSYGVFSYTDTGRSFWTYLSDVLCVSDFSDLADNYTVSLQMMDVGKADCILLEQGEYHVLIDCGKYENADTIAEYLRKREIENLDAFILSHYDSDHIGGAVSILSEFPADTVYCPAYAADQTQNQENLLEFCRENQIPTYYLSQGDSFSLGDFRFEVFEPGTRQKSSNDNSLVFRVDYFGFSALFTGDMADKELEHLLMTHSEDIRCDILKIPHHGSKYGISSEFLRKVDPLFALISSGENSSNLPAPETLSLLSDTSCAVFQTEQSGTVLIGWNEDGYHVKLEK